MLFLNNAPKIKYFYNLALLLPNGVNCINKKNYNSLPVKYSFTSLINIVLQKTILHKCLLLFFVCLYTSNAFAQPTADFSGSPVSGCAPLLVKFTDLSTGSPTSWKWDFGNGAAVSLIQNPSTTYSKSGLYKVTLIANNASGWDTLVKDQYIDVKLNPSVDFSGTPTNGCLPLPVQFTDQSTAGSGTISSWKWDFGDGSSASTQNPQHIYNSSGTFAVTLQVKNSFGCSGSVSKSKYINTSNSVKAKFINNIQGTCKPPVSLDFQNLSTGPSPISYQWDFGDGNTSTQINPSYSYSTAGNYTVTLIASAGGCSDTIRKLIVIGTVTADFNSPLTVCPGKVFTLANTSSPTPGSVFWDFGDGTVDTKINPTKTYATSGTYIIKMIADFGACRDSVSKMITILNKQSIAFTTNDTASCTPPFTVNFTNNSSGPASYLWDFGDGTPASPNPSHTYTTSGNFNVTLIGTNSFGCQDTLVKINYIKIQPATVSLPGLPVKNCVPFTYTFSSVINSPDAVVSYLWDFGDGNSSTAANPSHTFAIVGNYKISLKITTASGCVATTSVINGVSAGNKPTANFSGSPLVACASTPIKFTDLSSGNVNEWLWNFGDKATSNAKNPSHSYLDTGYFTISLTVRSSGCPDSISFLKYIHILPPVAQFTIKGNCALPYKKLFLESSKGADTFLWDFGDGTTSAIKNPTHIYADTGTYPVNLTVTNLSTGCQQTVMRDAQVVIEKAMFVTNDTSICKNANVNFRSQNINLSKISSYNWDFGDDSTITTFLGTVNHQYTKTGIFNVRLIITNVLKCTDTLIKPVYIKVGGPTAKFTGSSTITCANTSINFTDISLSDGTDPIVQWTWDYGDNTVVNLTGPPFTHIYAKAGFYTVKLKVTDSKGCMDSLVKLNYILASKPAVDFTTADSASCPFAHVHFISLSNGPNLQYLWNFGDGTTSDNANPAHQYTTTNAFTVSLKITDQYGCSDSLQKLNYISITTPKADFALSDSISECPPFFVTFTNLSANYTSLLWDFGDGNSSPSVNPTHFYYLPGTYIVKLRATGPGGCFDEKFATIVVKGPNGILSYTNIIGCDSVTTNFKASAQDSLIFTWDFGDGGIVKTTDSSISYTYTNSGFYLPRLILEDKNGCQVPIAGTDTVMILSVKSNFNSLPNTLCEEGNISFIDSSISNDLITNWQWNFGDSSTSLQQNPTHNYSSRGLYDIRLVASTSFGCIDTATKSGYIKIAAKPEIDISGNNTGCKLDPLTFNGIFLQPDTSIVTWQWDFRNGQTSSVQNPPSQTYLTSGNYTVNAVATNSSGCKDTAIKAITINPLPVTNAGNDVSLCLGSSVQLQVTGANTYQWLTPTIFLSCTNCANPFTSTPNNITYIVKGTNGFGCSALDSINITVKKPFNVTIIPQADSICLGESTHLNASYAENYIWTPASSLNNAFIRDPIANPGTNTIYKVLAFDSSNCFKDSAFVNISVFNYPTVNAGADKIIRAGTSITLTPTYSSDVISWLWSPASGLNCTNCIAPVATPGGTTTYTLKVQNKGACSAEDQVTIVVTCDNENIFIPNTFSPNGDGINDVFFPRGTGINMIRGMKIFNRWGQVVFERSNFYANDPASGWDGLVGGKQVSSDVYIFVIDVICNNGEVITKTGNVTLLK